MVFVETRFPVDISYGSSGGPEYFTDIVVSNGGYEQRNINWAQARARYNVAHGIKSQAQLDSLIAFFRARKGRANGFRFKDWSDYKAITQLIGTGDGVATDFQLIKSYDSGGVIENRTINKPVSDSVVVYLDGVVSSSYTLDDTTGVVQFSVAPAVGVIITADFEFDVPVRFDTDRLSASLDSYGVSSWNDIPLVEIRV
ncbi:MAG: DUF2460 domain-containing protein [Rickettsiales bacterium]